MKKTVTVSISLPKDISDKIDKMAEVTNITRSALITAMTSFIIKWSEEATAQAKKEVLNSLYGKKGE